MTPDFALHIIWTCYGTWLPGDDRGSVSNTLRPSGTYDPKRNAIDVPYTEPHAATHQRARRLQKHPTARLAADEAFRVAETLVIAAAARGWFVPRAAVMANHVHVVVMGCPADGSAIRRVLKGTTQAALSQAAGGSRAWWTAGGSDRYKNDERAVEEAMRYVADQEWKLAEVVEMIARRCQ